MNAYRMYPFLAVQLDKILGLLSSAQKPIIRKEIVHQYQHKTHEGISSYCTHNNLNEN